MCSLLLITTSNCRHPKPLERPQFTTISCKLSQPDSVLLDWSEEGENVISGADQLGGCLEATHDLYKDLQDTYKA